MSRIKDIIRQFYSVTRTTQATNCLVGNFEERGNLGIKPISHLDHTKTPTIGPTIEVT